MNANEVVDELFEPLCLRSQGNLETSIRGSDLTFDSVQLMYYKCLKQIFTWWSYIDSPDWILRKNQQ